MIGYLRVSTEDQGETGGGLAAQRARIEDEAARRPWRITRWLEDEESGRTLRRPALQEALLALEGEQEDGLVVAKLDRLSRSVHDCTGIMADAVAQGWALVSLEPEVDMTTPYGRAMAQMAMVFAELERELIGMRTREGMRALRALDLAEGRPSRFGRPATIDTDICERVLSQHRRGANPTEIARRLNRDGLLNTVGQPWAQGSVWALLRRLELQAGSKAGRPTGVERPAHADRILDVTSERSASSAKKS